VGVIKREQGTGRTILILIILKLAGKTVYEKAYFNLAMLALDFTS
jgi:hypothetical protein